MAKPGGRIGMANWTPDGAVGTMFQTIAKHAPPPPGVESPLRWGTEERLARAVRRRHLRPADRAPHSRQPFRSADHYIEFFRTYFGPTQMAYERVGAEGEQALTDDLRAFLEASEHRRRPRAGARGRVPAGGRDPRLSGAARSSGLAQDADRGADEEHGEEDQPGDRAALAERRRTRHRGERQEECDDHSHAAGSLVDRPADPGRREGGARLAEELGDGVGGRLRRARLAGGADEAAADDHPVGDPPTCAACSGVPIPKPTATGTSASALVAATSSASAVGQLLALARRADGRDDVDEAAGGGADLARRRSAGVVGATSGTSARPAAAKAARISSASSSGRSGTIAPAAPAAAARGGERLGAAVREDHVRVDHQHDREPLRRPRADLERRLERRRPPSSAAVAAAWIVGPSASGSENGTPSSIRSAPASA